MSDASFGQIQGDKLEVGKQGRGLSGSKGASTCLITPASSLTKASGDHGACEGIDHMMMGISIAY
jgi:hypothetical protein